MLCRAREMASREGCKACTIAVVVLSACPCELDVGPACVGAKTALERLCCGCCCCCGGCRCCRKSFGAITKSSREAMLTSRVVSVSHEIVGLLCWACSCWKEVIARDAAASATLLIAVFIKSSTSWRWDSEKVDTIPDGW